MSATTNPQPPNIEQRAARADDHKPFRATVHTRGRLFWLRRRFVTYIGWVMLGPYGVWLQDDDDEAPAVVPESAVLFPWNTVESVVQHDPDGELLAVGVAAVDPSDPASVVAALEVQGVEVSEVALAGGGSRGLLDPLAFSEPASNQGLGAAETGAEAVS